MHKVYWQWEKPSHWVSLRSHWLKLQLDRVGVLALLKIPLFWMGTVSSSICQLDFSSTNLHLLVAVTEAPSRRSFPIYPWAPCPYPEALQQQGGLALRPTPLTTGTLCRARHWEALSWLFSTSLTQLSPFPLTPMPDQSFLGQNGTSISFVVYISPLNTYRLSWKQTESERKVCAATSAWQSLPLCPEWDTGIPLIPISNYSEVNHGYYTAEHYCYLITDTNLVRFIFAVCVAVWGLTVGKWVLSLVVVLYVSLKGENLSLDTQCIKILSDAVLSKSLGNTA